MKALYWRPQRISLRVLTVINFVAFCGFMAVELYRTVEQQPYYTQKMGAARMALKAFRAIKEARQGHTGPIDPETDPAGSGLIGELISPVTTNTGHLPSKQTSINPNFAAVVVDMLRRSGVRTGDSVAIGFSGSFPALNICVLAAVHTLRLKPLIIASAGASQFGANYSEFTWPDMERELAERGIFPYRSLAVSPGGIEDRALGLSSTGKKALKAALVRSGLPVIQPDSYTDSLEKRMAVYREHAGDDGIRAYINVGGGTISVGTSVGKHLFKPGLNRSGPRGKLIDSVMSRFAVRGVPVIHLTKIDYLATRYGLPLQPTAIPAVGEGRIFVREGYNWWLTAVALVVVQLLLVAMLRFDVGHRLWAATRRDVGAPRSNPEPMV